MNNGNPISIVKSPFEPKDQNEHDDQRTNECIPNRVACWNQPKIHLLFAMKKTQMSIHHILGFRVLPNIGNPIFASSWNEAISVAEFLRQHLERQGIRTTLEPLTEHYCVQNGSGVYSRYDPLQSQIVIECVYGCSS